MANNLKISTKLGIGAAVLMVLIFVMGALGYYYLDRSGRSVDHIVNNNYGRIVAFKQVKDAVDTIDKSMLSMALTKDPALKEAEKAKIDQARKSYGEAIKKIEGVMANVKDPKTKAQFDGLLARIKEQLGKGKEHNVKLAKFAMEGKNDEASAIWSEHTSTISNTIDSLFKQLVKLSEERIEIRFNELTKETASARIVFIAISLVIMGLIAAGTFFTVRKITRSLEEGMKVADRLAEGDLTVDVKVTSGDEMGALLQSLGNMVAKWRGVVHEINTSADNIASASHQLSASAVQMSKGSDDQAQMSMQVATASEEMSQTVIDVARNTGNIAVSGQETVEVARSGKEVVDMAVREVEEIASTVDASATMVRSLGELSKQIGEIVNVINEIADQTNLLALNAAIEAARAGEHGRGFAVVADEVKKLAERTGNSTAEIADMIGNIQKEVNRAVDAMEDVKKKVSSGADLSQQAGHALNNIVKKVDDLQLMVQQIASATEEMTATSEGISKDIDSIANISKETSSASSQVSQASDELSRLSVSLQGVVKGFSV
ncbi:MAG TPA: HAMP domain-containing methyl-accepting chemotaxis protein [Syntrophorhabdaceae bacterium]|nr:HAMP domain-containing methyl-accepting chemotaxis protein [Syntrophorhabdaceae bacterium]